ncbi:hypothetical protein [Corynebacterium phocae]|uniref:hypothetical protein n=1 Tax=Corynebacterium phocae TaxID=161895 RepID=UPI00123AA675|nr:hypothetical protein [Corynebacterium phocae]KAA8726398.1 hypothetical protein F4V58_02455 [Corynebacterium phocae]
MGNNWFPIIVVIASAILVGSAAFVSSTGKYSEHPLVSAPSKTGAWVFAGAASLYIFSFFLLICERDKLAIAPALLGLLFTGIGYAITHPKNV